MGEMSLYNAAVNSVNRYKEQGEELADFDDFIREIEKEYSLHGVEAKDIATNTD